MCAAARPEICALSISLTNAKSANARCIAVTAIFMSSVGAIPAMVPSGLKVTWIDGLSRGCGSVYFVNTKRGAVANFCSAACSSESESCTRSRFCCTACRVCVCQPAGRVRAMPAVALSNRCGAEPCAQQVTDAADKSNGKKNRADRLMPRLPGERPPDFPGSSASIRQPCRERFFGRQPLHEQLDDQLAVIAHAGGQLGLVFPVVGGHGLQRVRLLDLLAGLGLRGRELGVRVDQFALLARHLFDPRASFGAGDPEAAPRVDDCPSQLAAEGLVLLQPAGVALDCAEDIIDHVFRMRLRQARERKLNEAFHGSCSHVFAFEKGV